MYLFHPNDYTNRLHVRDTNGWNVSPLIASQIQLVRFSIYLLYKICSAFFHQIFI